MELYRHLKERESKGEIIRTGLVGCGQMGSGMIHLTERMPGLDTMAIADVETKRPMEVLTSLGIERDQIVLTNVKGEAEDALINGKRVVTEDALLLPTLENLDAVVEATGITEIGAKVAWAAIYNQKNIVMLNVETDVTVGAILDRMARNSGSVYTVAAGDEPAVCKMLYDFSRTMGFEVICLGKGKNNPVDLTATPESCNDEAESKGMNPKMLASFKDGTKTMVEMAAVSNATGLLPDTPGMHGPEAELSELTRVFIPESDGGIFKGEGRVDYSTGAIAPGVFAIVTTDEPRIQSDMQFVSMGDGPYYLFFRPYHLCNLETPFAVAEAVIYGETTVTAETMHSEVVSVAKRDLKTGETIGGIGSADIYHKIFTYKEARSMRAIPMGIAPNGKVLKDVRMGEPLTEDTLAPDSSTFIYKLRRMQDAILELDGGAV